MDKEKRGSLRVPFHSKVLVRSGETLIDGEADNVSTCGMLLRGEGDIPPGSAVEVSLNIYGTTSHLSLSLKGTVTRREEKGLAISFTDVENDSFIHLRNIVAAGSFDENRIIESFENAPIDRSVHD